MVYNHSVANGSSNSYISYEPRMEIQGDPYLWHMNMDANGNGKKMPKLRDIFQPRRRQRQDSDSDSECPDLDFIYDDADTHMNEIAELYSYTEKDEFRMNLEAFFDQMIIYNVETNWLKMDTSAKKSVINKLLDQLEVASRDLRMRAARCFLYLAQGCWSEVESSFEQVMCARENVLMMYDQGVFHAFIDLLNIEIDNSISAYSAMRKIAVSLTDSTDLRVILSVLYIIIEVFRSLIEEDPEEYKRHIDQFKHDILHPVCDEMLIIKLFGMVTRFCGGTAPHFPMKKVLLLLWKSILVALGGTEVLNELKNKYRQEANLRVFSEDPTTIIREMRASSPPANATEILETQHMNSKRNNRPIKRFLIKQSSLDEQLNIELDSLEQSETDEEIREYEEGEMSQPDETPQPFEEVPANSLLARKREGLPWMPKVRQKDLDAFLENTRIKFLGFPLEGDRESLFGLPEPIHEGVRVLKEHMYRSLAEVQIEREEELAKSPISKSEGPVPVTPAELLYQAMYPNLPQYMIALLKILLAAAPTSKTKSDSINILADVLPGEMPMTVVQSMKLGTDVSRHKEIIVKAVSAILLLLLKHFKLNHIYQFEFMSQHLVFANCIPLVLKFFNQHIMTYVGAANVIPILDFPACVIGDPEINFDTLEIGDSQAYSWRNIFACINLLRILNKLTKWKHSRIMMLVVFKSAPILKRALKVRHGMMQLYVLKLLKMQTKYLGRQWRKSNMKTISAIYQKVRHRLNDDWAYGNDLDARPWDFQAEECALRTSVDRFNNRRYGNNTNPDFEPVDTCITSVLGQEVELTEEFKRHYDLWLQQEVFKNSIRWEELLDKKYI